MAPRLLRGTLDVLILKALSSEDLHGLGVSRQVARMTEGAYTVKPGSLFPALHRLEQAGWLESHWGESENNRRAKYYRLTSEGRCQLERETAEWKQVARVMRLALDLG